MSIPDIPNVYVHIHLNVKKRAARPESSYKTTLNENKRIKFLFMVIKLHLFVKISSKLNYFLCHKM